MAFSEKSLMLADSSTTKRDLAVQRRAERLIALDVRDDAVEEVVGGAAALQDRRERGVRARRRRPEALAGAAAQQALAGGHLRRQRGVHELAVVVEAGLVQELGHQLDPGLDRGLAAADVAALHRQRDTLEDRIAGGDDPLAVGRREEEILGG